MPQQALLNFLQQPSPAQQARQQHQVLMGNQRAILQKNRIAAGQQRQANQQLLGNQKAILARNKGILAQQQAVGAQAKQQQQQAIAQGNLALRGIREQRLQRGVTQSSVMTAAEGIQSVGEGLGSLGDRVTAWADNVPTPGGIGLLLALIFLLLWAVVPVNNGKTRLQLLWYTLTGRTKMALQPDPATITGTWPGGIPTGPFPPIPPTGSGGNQNPSPVSALLNSLPIRDFGGSA